MTYKKFINRFYGLIEISFCTYFTIISIFCTILMSILALADKEIIPYWNCNLWYYSLGYKLFYFMGYKHNIFKS